MVKLILIKYFHFLCVLEDKLWYCGSFVLWIFGNGYRTDNTLYGLSRVHRIGLKKINSDYYKEISAVEKFDLKEVL